MHDSGLVLVKQLLEGGFYYDNLSKMAQGCREEAEPDRLVSAYVLGSIFSEFAEIVESEPYKKTQENLEVKYKPIINSILEKVISGLALDDQIESLTALIKLNWGIKE